MPFNIIQVVKSPMAQKSLFSTVGLIHQQPAAIDGDKYYKHVKSSL